MNTQFVTLNTARLPLVGVSVFVHQGAFSRSSRSR